MEVLGKVLRSADESPDHTCNDEEDAEEDQDGLSLTALRARLEREVPNGDFPLLFTARTLS